MTRPTHEQFQKLHDRIGPMLGYLCRLRERLEHLGYGPGDPYYQAVNDAFNAMHTLSVKTHYASCEGGVG